VDAPDLSPASRRKRPAPAPKPVPTATADIAPSEVVARLAALESAARTIDIRLEAIERLLRTLGDDVRGELQSGFQEAASRSVVLAEAGDAALARLVSAVERIPTEHPAPAPPADLSSIESAIAALPKDIPSPADLSGVQAALDSVVELKVIVATLAAAVEAMGPAREESDRRIAGLTVDMAALRAPVDLIAERLATLLGGPSLTDLLDRIDELDRQVATKAEEPKKRRRL
jgi:hypothetical protein